MDATRQLATSQVGHSLQLCCQRSRKLFQGQQPATSRLENKKCPILCGTKFLIAGQCYWIFTRCYNTVTPLGTRLAVSSRLV